MAVWGPSQLWKPPPPTLPPLGWVWNARLALSSLPGFGARSPDSLGHAHHAGIGGDFPWVPGA